MKLLRLLPLFALTVACETPSTRARSDSAQALATEQRLLAGTLAAQKDSLTRVVDDADKFISQIDSQISRVKGLPKPKRGQKVESPME